MSLLKRLLARSRVRGVRQALAADPSAKNYLALALEHVRLGEMREVQRLCEEALEVHAGHTELQRLADRARTLALEDRTRELVRELRDAPRPGLYRELAEIYLQSGREERAEEAALQWFTDSGDGLAQLYRAQARLSRFRADKRREDGRVALELLESAAQLLDGDERPLRMKLELMCAVGAWGEARRLLSQLLEHAPGESSLEARYRTINALADTAPTFEAALRECERTGRLATDGPARAPAAAPVRSVRPMLKELASSPGVQWAIFERSATALVQGPRGATAERSARAVREIVQKTRTTARRLGLGTPTEIEIEGLFGSVFVAPNEQGSAAVWCNQDSVPERYRLGVLELIGAVGDEEQEGAE